MAIGICSIFHNSTAYLDRFSRQVVALEAAHPIETVLVFGVESGSDDGTWEKLSGIRASGSFRRVDPPPDAHYEHIDDSRRWAAIAKSANVALDMATARNMEFVVYVESDLIWKPSMMIDLVNTLMVVPAVAPMCFWLRNGHFYDTWGYRRNGVMFHPEPPYHPYIPPVGLTPIDSAGSCIAMRREVFSQCRFQPEDGIVGLCRDIKAKGFQLWLDTGLAVCHPAEHNT